MIQSAADMNGSDRLLIVTGATSGIGSAIARRVAAPDSMVVLVGRNTTAGIALQQELQAANKRALFIAADLTDRKCADQIVAAAMEFGGRIDGLVNNAGILFTGKISQTSDEDWDRVIDINLSAAFRLSRAVLPIMLAQRQGVILNIASDWAIMGARGALAYAVSKAALAQFSRCLALDHAKEGVRVNALCPGDTDTPMLNLASDGPDRDTRMAALAADIPMGRVARVEEVAAMAAFFLSDQASFTTGAFIPVDGGTTAQ